ERLQGHAGMFKVGSELFTAEGPVPVRYLVTTGHRVFLDLKFHDIPNTVRAAAREAAELGVSMVNVHASGGRKMMEAALEGARSAVQSVSRRMPGSAGIAVGDEARPRVLAVTILTSLASQDLEELGISGMPVEAVLRLARLAQSAGLDGVVASPREISAIRQACGPGFLIVTPGIRPASAATDDQARIATPASAIVAGADYLVVGRPITGAPDPVAAADAIVAEMDGAMD
ncbi:MAG: orotidine-5'-phosphate decarboxylase, partial [Verrucomicrobiota bacterium]